MHLRVLILFASLATTTAWAEPASNNIEATTGKYELSDSEREFFESLRPDPDSSSTTTPKPYVSPEMEALAREVLQAGHRNLQTQQAAAYETLGINEPDRPDLQAPLQGEWVEILVSRSLGRSAIEAIAASASASDIRARLVFQGVPEGEKLNAMSLSFLEWTQGMESPPEMTIDPTAYIDNNVTVVPTMLHMRDGKVVARVSGLTRPGWFAEQDVERIPASGDYGVLGPISEISEPNLMTVMQQRFAAIDWEAKKEESLRTYWQRHQQYRLQPATESQVSWVDPTLVVQRDIVDGQGNVIAQQGTRINPLDMREFQQRLVIFNATRPEELAWVSTLPPGQKPTVYMTTELDPDIGWDQLEDAQRRLQAPVYVMTQEIWQRFQISYTPSIVTDQDRQFKVQSFNVASEESSQ